MSVFQPVYAVDVNGLPVANMKGSIHAVTDTGGTVALNVTDPGGTPMSLVSISAAGVNQAFVVADYTEVLWISEDAATQVMFQSLDGLEAAASTAEETAESALSQVAAFVARVGVPGGVAGLNTEGNVTDANGYVVGNETRRSGAVIWASGSETPRPTASREVMVLWITDGDSPVNAIPGIDYWLNAGVVK